MAKGAAVTLPYHALSDPPSAPYCSQPYSHEGLLGRLGDSGNHVNLCLKSSTRVTSWCRKVTASRPSHRNVVKAREEAGRNTKSLTPLSITPCPEAGAMLQWPAPLYLETLVSLPVYEPTQLSWQAREWEKSWLRFQLFWSQKEGGAESSEKLLKCQLLPNVHSATARSWIPATQCFKREAIKSPLN